jgi:FMN reductase
VVVPTGVFAATEDFGNRGLDARIARAAGELSALMGASTSAVAAPTGRRTVGDEFADPIPFEQLLQQVGAA